jgi:hypothetical protein
MVEESILSLFAELRAFSPVIENKWFLVYHLYVCIRVMDVWMCAPLAPERLHGFHSYSVFKSVIHPRLVLDESKRCI